MSTEVTYPSCHGSLQSIQKLHVSEISLKNSWLTEYHRNSRGPDNDGVSRLSYYWRTSPIDPVQGSHGREFRGLALKEARIYCSINEVIYYPNISKNPVSWLWVRL